MRKRELKNMEWGLVIVAIILTIIGLIALFSATQETEYDEFKNLQSSLINGDTKLEGITFND